MSMTDVTVVGAGPIGLATAIFAAQAGLSAVVLDAGPRDGDKACGEGLMPGTKPLLDQLGIDPPGHPLEGVVYAQGAHRVEHRFPGPAGRGVRRTALREALLRKAVDLGVQVREEKYTSLTQTKDEVCLTTEQGATLTSRYAIGCDGLHSKVAQDMGVVKAVPRSAKRYGLRQHFFVKPWSSLIEVYYSKDAEVYITPVSDNTVGVAVLGRKGVNLETAVAGIPQLHTRLAGAEPASTLRGAGPFPHRARTQRVGRVLLVGDSGGYVDAITGEGLRVGFAQALAAIEALAIDTPAGYPKAWKKVTREFRVLTKGLVALASSPLRSSIVPLAHALPGLFGVVVNRLAR